jgi:hypothetical protein
MPLSKDLREFIALLNSNEVEYLVVGAFAVAWHGWPRYTADLDVLVRPSEGNVGRLFTALAQFGFGTTGIQAGDFLTPGMVIQLGIQPNRVDILTSISGLSFDEAWDSRTQGSLEGIEARFIGRDALILNKESTGRAKDLGDAGELRKRPRSQDE